MFQLDANYNAMKTLLILLVAICGAGITYGQSPAPDPDTLQNPVKQIDPEVKQLPANGYDAKSVVRITADELPLVVRDSIKRLHPTGWEKSVVYRDKKSSLYIIDVREAGGQKVYKFDQSGKRLRDENEENN